MTIHTAQSAQEFETAYRKFVAAIPRELDDGHLQMAKQCISGVTAFWDLNVNRRGERYLYLQEGDDVRALARIQIEPNSVKLQDVTGSPLHKGSGATLAREVIEIARRGNKATVWLEAASVSLGTYYQRYGFQFDTPNATSGRMTLNV